MNESQHGEHQYRLTYRNFVPHVRERFCDEVKNWDAPFEERYMVITDISVVPLHLAPGLEIASPLPRRHRSRFSESEGTALAQPLLCVDEAVEHPGSIDEVRAKPRLVCAK